VSFTAEVVAQHVELAGLVRSEGKLDFIARDQVSAQIEIRQRKAMWKIRRGEHEGDGLPLTSLI
jgi:hypothetical protein